MVTSDGLVPLHTVSKAFEIVGPFFGLQQVNFVLFYEHSQMLFHRHHFFVGPVSGLCLQLRIHLLYFAGAYKVGTGVVVVKYFHRYNPAGSILFGYELLAYNIGQPQGHLIADLGLSAGGEVV